MYRVVTEVLLDDKGVCELVDFCVLVDQIYANAWRRYRDLVMSPLARVNRVALYRERTVMEEQVPPDRPAARPAPVASS